MNKQRALRLQPGDHVLVGKGGGNSAHWKSAIQARVITVTPAGGVLVALFSDEDRSLGQRWCAYSHVQPGYN